ncbi:MAG: site-2 protease family protein [Phycisphaerales bacterium]|nr:site-2 protease family protein [Phycisphaerales bacterium]
MNWWVHNAWEQGGAVELTSWIFWVLLSITLHELAHGWAALWEGDTTPRDLNRLTANPLVHMGQTSLIVFAIIGFAYGMMPVRPDRFRHGRLGEAIVAFAGPMMNLALAFISLTLLGIIVAASKDSAFEAMKSMHTFLFMGGFLNLVLFALNLLPIPPLDGSRMLAAGSLHIRRFHMQPQAQIMAFALLIAIFFFGAASSVIGAAQELAVWWASMVAQVLAGAA